MSSICFESTLADFDRFSAIIHRADTKRGSDRAITVCCSMLLAVQCFLIAMFGREEAARIMREYVENVIAKTRLQ